MLILGKYHQVKKNYSQYLDSNCTEEEEESIQTLAQKDRRLKNLMDGNLRTVPCLCLLTCPGSKTSSGPKLCYQMGSTTIYVFYYPQIHTYSYRQRGHLKFQVQRRGRNSYCCISPCAVYYISFILLHLFHFHLNNSFTTRLI